MSREVRLEQSRSRTTMLWLTCDDLHANAGASEPIPEKHTKCRTRLPGDHQSEHRSELPVVCMLGITRRFPPNEGRRWPSNGHCRSSSRTRRDAT